MRRTRIRRPTWPPAWSRKRRGLSTEDTLVVAALARVQRIPSPRQDRLTRWRQVCALSPLASIYTYSHDGSTTGHATKIAPLQGWATPSLSAYFNGLNYVQPRTATRPIPETPTAITSSQPEPGSPNVRAIAGGTVGGVIALIALIAAVVLCLRRRNRKKTPYTPRSELDTATRSELENFTIPQKHLANYSIAEDRPYYYASPAETSAVAGQMDVHEVVAELPDSRSPASAELPDVRSPVNGELPDTNLSVPGRRYE
jgi:hypothetical protein